MSVRVVARIRPLLGEAELEKDRIVQADLSPDGKPTIVRIPSPKSASEEFKFTFNAVYDECSQEEIYTNEVSPHVKSLFNGLDVTIFAYGVTGTGKTHTMRGGTKLADRGVIPRLLSGIYRRGRKVAKDSGGETSSTVTLSYYEIYNDKVFDLFQSSEKRPPAGLPLREKDGKTMVIGLSEWACDDLKDFERLYIEANNNRSTAGTKLNAQSSRSHAILMVKLTQITGDKALVSMASAIDLAGSEDNRRTDNGKERLVESASINKSLFVLSQCIDAIGRGDKRIPYRESKMTRILSLGQNNGITIMILNLAPLRSYHLDTLSSLNVSSRAKRIEVREIENEVVFTQPPRKTSSIGGSLIQRQPLKPLTNNAQIHNGVAKAVDKPSKAFSVYTDNRRLAMQRSSDSSNQSFQKLNTKKRASDTNPSGRLSKVPKHNSHEGRSNMPDISAKIEQLVDRKVTEIMASRAMDQAAPAPLLDINDEVRRRLEELEKRVENGSSDPRADGFRFLLMAKQHKERGEDSSALRMYELAVPFFPDQQKLHGKILNLRAKIQAKKEKAHKMASEVVSAAALPLSAPVNQQATSPFTQDPEQPEMELLKPAKTKQKYEDEDDFQASVCEDDDSFTYQTKKSRKPKSKPLTKPSLQIRSDDAQLDEPCSPRTKRLLRIVNTRDIALIRGLGGVGQAKAKMLIEFLERQNEDESVLITSMEQLQAIPGLGARTVEKAREGIVC